MIDENKCIRCGKCETVCESLKLNAKNGGDNQKYYSAINKDAKVVKYSGSGGMFTALANVFLKNGGTVYGAGYTDAFAVSHRGVNKLEELSLITGTKYTQSSILGVYELVKEDLVNGKKVLFVGTPCQCSAMRQFLSENKIDDSLLLVVDIFCHGVFSPTIWGEYIELLEEKFGEKITFFSFRDKEKGWRNKQLKVLTESKDVSDYCNYQASVLRMYEQNLSFRDVCYKCSYMNLSRVGDISIGDFWGIERVKPSLDKNTGVSAVLVNTKKGEEIIEEIKGEVTLTEFKRGEILQQVLREPTRMNPRRKQFIRDYKENGAERLFSKYGQVKGKQRIKRDILVPILYKFRVASIASKLLHIKD